MANKALLANDAYIPTPLTNWVWDWESASAAEISPTVLQLGVKGLMEDKSAPVIPTQTIPTMPYKDTAEAAKLQAYVSTWAIDGFFASGLQVYPLAVWYNSTDTSGPKLLTDELSVIMPGIVDAYGTGVPVNVNANFTAITNVQSVAGAGALSGDMTVRLTFAIANKATGVMEEAAQLTL